MENQTMDDFSQKKQKKRKRTASDILLDVLRFTIIIIAAGIFTYSSYSLTKTMLEYKEGDDEYDSINKLFQVSAGESKGKSDQGSGKNQTASLEGGDADTGWLFDYDKLLAINPDAKGYIRQIGTTISYPVLQCSNNSYYLYHTFDNTYNRNGSVFIDYHITKGFDAKNCIIYGHNMWTDTMFGTLTNYTSSDYYQAHPTFDVYAGYKHYIYRVFASFEANASGDPVYTYDFKNNAEFLKWANEQRARSYLNTSDVRELTKKDHVITLSTCTTGGDDSKRVIVMIYREEEVK